MIVVVSAPDGGASLVSVGIRTFRLFEWTYTFQAEISNSKTSKHCLRRLWRPSEAIVIQRRHGVHHVVFGSMERKASHSLFLSFSFFFRTRNEGPRTGSRQNTTAVCCGRNSHDSLYHDRRNKNNFSSRKLCTVLLRSSGSLVSLKQTSKLCADTPQLRHQRNFPRKCPLVSFDARHHRLKSSYYATRLQSTRSLPNSFRLSVNHWRVIGIPRCEHRNLSQRRGCRNL